MKKDILATAPQPLETCGGLVGGELDVIAPGPGVGRNLIVLVRPRDVLRRSPA